MTYVAMATGQPHIGTLLNAGHVGVGCVVLHIKTQQKERKKILIRYCKRICPKAGIAVNAGEELPASRNVDTFVCMFMVVLHGGVAGIRHYIAWSY